MGLSQRNQRPYKRAAVCFHKHYWPFHANVEVSVLVWGSSQGSGETSSFLRSSVPLNYVFSLRTC